MATPPTMKSTARATTILALAIAGSAVARTLPTITDKATGWDSPSGNLNVDVTGTITNLSLSSRQQKIGDWYRREWNDADYDVQLEKEVGDNSFGAAAQCFVDTDHAAFLGAQPVTVNGYPYRVGPKTVAISSTDYLAAQADAAAIPVPSTLDFVSAVRFLIPGAHIAATDVTVRFTYTSGSPNDVVVPIAVDTATGAARAGSGTNYSKTAFTGLTHTANAAFDEDGVGGSDCAGSGGDEVVVTNPDTVRQLSSVTFLYTPYGDAAANTGWLEGPIAVAMESDQPSLEGTFAYVGMWSSSVTTADSPVDMPAHNDTAIWYQIDYNTGGLAGASTIFVHFQCGNDTNGNGTLSAGELSVEQIVELSQGAGSVNLTNCFGRYVQYDVELVDAFDDDPRLLDITFYYDADNDDDGYGDDGVVTPNDCNDADAAAHPGAPEIVGNNVDNDCSGSEDCYVDADNDGYRTNVVDAGGTNNDNDCNDPNEGLATDGLDCADTDAAIRPGVAEIKGDEIDQNCDGQETCWPDADNDGDRANAGSQASADTDCADPNEGRNSDPIDCNDGNAAIFSGAVEIKGDEIDQNCDGQELCWPDADNDGDRANTGQVVSANTNCTDPNEGKTSDPIDCNDSSAAIFSGAVEITGDNIDQNCNGIENCFTDADDDGARLTTTVIGGSNNDADCNDPNEGITGDPIDCNDGNAAINPSATEIKGDEIDQNCDGQELCWPDADNDGDRANAGQQVSADADCLDPNEGRNSDPIDCNDGNAAINNAAVEIAGDSVDQNCNGTELCFTDADNDGARLTTTVNSADTDCLDANEGVTADPIDCNDGNAAINPAAAEIKGDNVDQNCDGQESCWPDADHDGERANAGSVVSLDTDCIDVGEGETTDTIDCNDADVAINSLAAEIAGDNVDQNCNGIENCFTDADNDGARLTTVVVGGSNSDADCNDPNEAVAADPIDCNDTTATVSPLLSETIGNNVDNNCDGQELCWPNVDNDNDRANVGSVVSADSDCTDANEGETTDPVDCDDTRADRASNLAEVPGNNVDNDCNGVENCFTDADNDGNRLDSVVIGGSNNDADCLDANEGEATDTSGDCNDNDNTVRVGAVEIVGNNVDNNCVGGEDCYTDADNDNARLTTVVIGGTNGDNDCLDPNEGQASEPIDCNDSNPLINPAATEIAGDNVDQNCNGTELCFTDADNDGARLTTTVNSPDTDCLDANEGEATDAIDCVDNNPAINPAAAEIKGDEVDQNCDGQETCWPDVDRDGARAGTGQQASSDVDCQDPGEGATVDLVDCDDNDASRSPLLAEITGNEHDENCDGQEVCFADADNDNSHHATNTVVSADFDCADNGEDPATTLVDCADNNADRSPYLTETGAYLANGVDNDCDGGEICYLDADNDDYRSVTTTVSTDADCNDNFESLATAGQDCNDAVSTINPGVADICGNGIDDDCSGNASNFGGLSYADDDGDGLDYTTEYNYQYQPGVGCHLDDCDSDSDGDGVSDDDEYNLPIRSNACSSDTDGDGLDDLQEVGPNPNAPFDTDGDGTPDVRDTDDDNDGILTSIEVAARADVDGDGIPNWKDLDSDGDGYSDEYEWDEALNQTTHDTNGDGDADYVDVDSDGDNLNDALELGTQLAPQDTDSDGIDDRLDDDDDGDCVPTRQELGVNTDADGVTDYLDDDDDDDGLTSCQENPDGVGTPFADDTDRDGTPNFRDPDDDDDGIPTVVEITITRPNCLNDGDSLPTHLDTDSDGDGWTDDEETTGANLDNFDGDPDIDMCDLDSDQDRVTDALEQHADTDGDGAVDRVDPDDDGDTIRTDLECGDPTPCDADPLNDDTDSDRTPNYLDPDDDNDLVDTIYEVPHGDTDLDGHEDWADIDDDEDSVLTRDELPRTQDLDGDGFENYRDPDDDGDTLLTKDEKSGGSPLNWDFDNDGDPNFLDVDDDNDQKYTLCEVLWLDSVGGYHLNVDSDNDGLSDGEEWGAWNGTGPVIIPDDCAEPVNTDGTDYYDVLDTDDDNDGLLTFLEIFSTEVYDRSADDDCLWDDANSNGIIDEGEFDPAIPAGDGIPDHRDTDSDNDGIPDGGVDPDTNALESFGEDSDLDGIDNIDDCDSLGCDGDSDGDGLSNARETLACCLVRDTTGDDDLFSDQLSTGDIDRMCTSLKQTPLSTANGCGCALTTTRDFDADGVIDPEELEALDGPQPDDDGDGLPNVIDDDDDGDGLLSRVENLYQRPTDCSLGQWDAGQTRVTQLCDQSFTPEYILADREWGYRCGEGGVITTFALCPELSNIDAAGADEPGNPLARRTDAIENYLDADDDGDGTPTLQEQGPNPDIDCDGIVNWFDRADENGDCADADGDGISNEDEIALGSNPYSDDSDDDGLSDAIEFGDGDTARDSDGDGLPDLVDPDDDDDGVPTVLEGQVDTDGDGTPDYLDADSDDDGTPDGEEGMGDGDCDGVPDRFDDADDGACDSASTPLKYVRGQCACDSSSPGTSFALALGALAILVRRRRA